MIHVIIYNSAEFYWNEENISHVNDGRMDMNILYM